MCAFLQDEAKSKQTGLLEINVDLQLKQARQELRGLESHFQTVKQKVIILLPCSLNRQSLLIQDAAMRSSIIQILIWDDCWRHKALLKLALQDRLLQGLPVCIGKLASCMFFLELPSLSLGLGTLAELARWSALADTIAKKLLQQMKIVHVWPGLRLTSMTLQASEKIAALEDCLKHDVRLQQAYHAWGWKDAEGENCNRKNLNNWGRHEGETGVVPGRGNLLLCRAAITFVE